MPATIYCDGGLLLSNPSPHGGTFAWVLVEQELRVKAGSGIVLPADMGMAKITNNLTELLAIVSGLENLPDGWEGTVASDSAVTLQRVISPKIKMNGIPWRLRNRLERASKRLGALTAMLLGGHPTQAEIASGRSKSGYPTSPHQVWCDRECNRISQEWRRHQTKSTGI